jgi:hypothetical protein
VKNVYSISVVEPEGRRPLGRLRHKWEDNIRMGLREVRWKDVEWMYLAQGRDQWWALVKMVMNPSVP